MADAPDSKSGRGNPVRVQVPPPAPKINFFSLTHFIMQRQTTTPDFLSLSVAAIRE